MARYLLHYLLLQLCYDVYQSSSKTCVLRGTSCDLDEMCGLLGFQLHHWRVQLQALVLLRQVRNDQKRNMLHPEGIFDSFFKDTSNLALRQGGYGFLLVSWWSF